MVIRRRKNTPTEKELFQFLEGITKLETVEFLGLAHMLGVPLLDGEKNRQADEILSDVIDKFIEAKRKKRRIIFQILEAAQEGI